MPRPDSWEDFHNEPDVAEPRPDSERTKTYADGIRRTDAICHHCAEPIRIIDGEWTHTETEWVTCEEPDT